VQQQISADNLLCVQIRNPLHAMYGAVALLSSGTLHSDAADAELLRLHEGIDVMISVTTDLLDAEALRLGRLRVQPAMVNLRALLTRWMPRSTPACPAVLGIAPEVPEGVALDPLRLRQVRDAVDLI
jgi:signal transduction histidine kinase